jgi:hypothetical protein
MRMAHRIVALSVCIWIAGCGEPAAQDQRSSGDPRESITDAATPRVQISAPAEGDTIDRGDVTVRLVVEGLVVVPAGVEQASSGHHHLLVDSPLPELNRPIPSEAGRYIHLGKGQTDYLLEGLAAGQHQVIALVGDHLHVPLNPPVADTVRFVVR